MEPYSPQADLISVFSAVANVLEEASQGLGEVGAIAVSVNAAPVNTPQLRSQAEFFMTGILPAPAQPDVACSTCLEQLTDDVVKMVKRGHMFHCTCVLPWFQSRNLRRGACPKCRTELFEPAPLTASYVPHAPPLYTPLGGAGHGGPLMPLVSEASSPQAPAPSQQSPDNSEPAGPSESTSGSSPVGLTRLVIQSRRAQHTSERIAMRQARQHAAHLSRHSEQTFSASLRELFAERREILTQFERRLEEVQLELRNAQSQGRSNGQ